MVLRRYFDNCSLSVDKVSFSIVIIGNATKKEFFEALTNLGFECKRDYRIKNNKKKYKRRRKYIVENSVIIFTYQRRNDASFLPDIWCVYQDPSRPVLNLLDSLCNSLGFVTKVSQVELAIDFPYTRKLKRFFNKYLYLKFNRGNPCVVGKGDKKSCYSGNKAKNSKTTIVYQKIINGTNHLRLELILNRRIIKRLNLDLRMEVVNNLDLSQFVCFRKFSHILSKFFNWGCDAF